MKTCAICEKLIHTGDPHHFVKVKGQRERRGYCKECMKGGGKHGDTDGERH